MRQPSCFVHSLLSAGVFLLLLFVHPAFGQNSPAHTAQLEKDALEMQQHTLSMDEITRLLKAGHALTQAGDQDPALAAGMHGKEGGDDQQTLDQMNTVLSSSPKIIAILHDFGFTPRSFALAELTLVQSSLATYAVQGGQSQADVVKSLKVNPSNIALIQAHTAEIEQLHKQYPGE